MFAGTNCSNPENVSPQTKMKLGALPGGTVPHGSARSTFIEGESPVAWFISYQHSLRLDEAGIKLVCDRMEAYAEKLRLEARGYIITKVTQKKLPPEPLLELDTQIRLL
jgi:hypothetical protein